MIKLIQFSDSHIQAKEHKAFERGLARCVAAIEKDRPALVVATGDITDDGSLSGYAKFAELTQPIATKCWWSPGNHDCRKTMESFFDGPLQQVMHFGSWTLILLDSAVPGEIPGRIGERQLTWLSHILDRYSDRNIGLFSHHPPEAVGSEWIDSQCIRDAREFAQTIKGKKQIKFVANGHVHQEGDREFAGIPWYSTPATCRQFLVGSKDFAVDKDLSVGYRQFLLEDDGSFSTSVIRV